MARLILIADDSPIIQRRAQRILQDEGFEVQTVSNGVAAVKKLPVMQPVLVLADVSMPGKDGYEVCEFVKTSAGLRNVPVLLVGSDLEPYDEQRGARVRADGIIKKPFAPHDLIALVRRFTAPAKAPAPPTPEETLVASSPATAQVAPIESNATPDYEVLGEGREEDTTPADVSPPLHVADDVVSNVEQQACEHPEHAPETLPEPAATPGEPFPGFVVGPVTESGSEVFPEGAPVHAPTAPEGSLEVEESMPEEIAQCPKLVDLTAPETVAAPAWPVAEPTPEPVSEVLPEPVIAEPETTQALEESPAASQSLETSASLAAAPERIPGAPEERPESIPDVTPEPASAGPERIQEWGGLLSTPPAIGTSAAPDAEWVYKVVHKVVSRMAPPVLALEQVEELARMLTREIESEFGGRDGQTGFLPERSSPD